MNKTFIIFLALLASIFATAIIESSDIIPEVKKNHVHGLKARTFLTGPSNDAPLDIATKFIEGYLSGYKYEITDNYQTKHNKVTHIYGRQIVNGRPVSNALFNININGQGRVINFAETFFKGNTNNVITFPAMQPLTSLKNLASHLRISLEKKNQLLQALAEKREYLFSGGDLSLDNIPVSLSYVQNESGDTLELVWHINIRREEHWYDAYLTADRGRVVFLNDYFKQASYNVYPITVNDPFDGDRQIVTDPHLPSSGSPLGWHDQGEEQFTDTIGNNVYAQENVNGLPSWENNYRPDGGADLEFDFPIDFTKEPEDYMDAAITNLFYWNNIMHDIFYEYGFDEVSGNFQENNFDNGGKGDDAVQANAQDGSGYNNANFATPPDGQRPRMRMYLWNGHTPMRDGDLDNGIIIHEYAHGISIRLVGGPGNSNCMSGGQAGGMGEGIGDCFSLFFRWRPEEYDRDTIFEMADYSAGNGIRLFPYAYNMTINTQTYSVINGGQYSGVHAKGCVWCTIIYDTFLDFIEKYGFDKDWYNGSGGNNVLLQLMVDSYKLSPCNPTFVDARDAMLLADENNYAGKHFCDLWKAFARRGVGLNAVDTNNNVRDDFNVPSQCA